MESDYVATPNYNLPTITGNMAADVVRDMNALAEATDSAIKDAVDGIDLSNIEQDISNVDNRFTQHSDNQQIHVTQAKQNSWDAKVNRSGDTMSGDLVIERDVPSITLRTPNTTNSMQIMLNATDAVDLGVSLSKDNEQFMLALGSKDVRFVANDGEWFSIQDLKLSVSSGKTAIANATTQMGVPTDSNAEFATMATNILSINTGKKFATGVGAGATTMYSFRRAYNNEVVESYGLTVSGLDFKPGLILAFDATTISMYQNYLSLGSTQQTGGVVTDFTTITAFGGGTQTAVNTLHGTGGDGYVNNGGFRIPIRSNTITVNWIAIE